jgi:hypothetical protein
MILDHVKKQPEPGRATEIRVIMEKNGRITSIMDAEGGVGTILDGVDRGELKLVKISLLKWHFWSKLTYQLPMRPASLLDDDIFAVAKMTVEALNKE